jgi:hypothetical protein
VDRREATAFQLPFCMTKVSVNTMTSARRSPLKLPLCAARPVTTAAVPYWRTGMSDNLMEFIFKSPDFRTAIRWFVAAVSRLVGVYISVVENGFESCGVGLR